jgi:hypothetical protein
MERIAKLFAGVDDFVVNENLICVVVGISSYSQQIGLTADQPGATHHGAFTSLSHHEELSIERTHATSSFCSGFAGRFFSCRSL